MEQESKQFEYQCLKHPGYNLEYIQINNLEANQIEYNLFCCSLCATQNSNFIHSNYQLIQEIIQYGDNQIISKWPPVNDDKLINQLIQIQKGNQEIQLAETSIRTYFTDLKDSILQQIDASQYKMIHYLQGFQQNKSQILKQYQELSMIKYLRFVLLEGITDVKEKERQCRALLQTQLNEKTKNTQLLTNLLTQYSNQSIFNSDSALQIKESILKSIDEINLFVSNSNFFIQNNNNNNYYNKNRLDDNNKNNDSINGMKLDMKLVKTDLNDGQNGQEISQNYNNQYQFVIKKQNSYHYNTVSNEILRNEMRYIFRIKIQFMKKNDSCYIGLMQDSLINVKEGYEDKLSCLLINDESKLISLSSFSDDGIVKKLKGDGFVLSSENEIEMRVCLKDKLLEILDYPYYHYKIGLRDKYKHKLIDHQNLRLYIGMYALDNKIILKEAFIVDKFQ